MPIKNRHLQNLKTDFWCCQRILWAASKRLINEHYTYHAAALAFTTLLSLVPLLSVILYFISIFPFFTRFVDLAQGYIFSNFIPTSSQVIQLYLERFIQQAQHLPTLGILFSLITSFMLIVTVEHTLNAIWHVKKKIKRFSSLLIYWGILVLAPVLIGLSVFLSTYLFSLAWFSGTKSLLSLQVLPLLINTGIFSILYIIVPNDDVKWKEGLAGGFIAAALFGLANKGFALYIQKFPSYELIYGTFATIPIFLVWIYISWLIILFGALVTSELHRLRKKLS